jgi:hypothetical protein
MIVSGMVVLAGTALSTGMLSLARIVRAPQRSVSSVESQPRARADAVSPPDRG